MAPWTERLLTKIKKFYVVRLILPSDSRESPLVTPQDGQDGARLHSKKRQQQQQQILKSFQSFSNSHLQLVPDSDKTEGARSGVSKAALSAAAEPDKPNGDIETRLLLRSSDSESSSSSTVSSGGGGNGGGSGGGGSGSRALTTSDAASAGRERRLTPRLRISDSSQVTDVESTALHQFLVRHKRRRTQKERRRRPHQPMSSLNCTGGQPELQQWHRDRKSTADQQATEVSVPASFALPPSQPVLQSQALFTAVPIDKLKIRSVGVTEEGSWGSRLASKELLVALLLNDPGANAEPPSSVSKPSRTRSRASLKLAAAAAAASQAAELTSSPETLPDVRTGGRRSRRPKSPDWGVTRTITFSIARDSRDRRPSQKQARGLVVKPRRRQWILPTASDDLTIEVPTTSSMTTTTSSSKTVTPSLKGTSVTASASPRRHRRHQQQQRLRRGAGSEPGTFHPTFSRIVKWSEATDSSQ